MFDVLSVPKDYDENDLYFNEYYQVNETFAIRQPTVQDILDLHEDTYFTMVYTLMIYPTQLLLELHEAKKDWTQVEDFDLFIDMTRDFGKDLTYPILGDMDLSKMSVLVGDDGEKCLTDGKYVMDQISYARMVNYLRDMHGTPMKRKKYKGKATKRAMIQMARDERAAREKNPPSNQCNMKRWASFAINSAGFKYNKNELKQCGIVEFFDSIDRLGVIMNAQAIMQGCYSGMVDGSKINKELLDPTRAIVKKDSGLLQL